ncbi:MAG: class I SAM-dependent methyltransferase [Ktedonobacteraceae bacterium]
MSTDPSGKNEYFIDAENAAEMARLIDQESFITGAMGGLFAERSDIATMRSILDLGCGPGQWARDVALQYPRSNVTGVDISNIMIQYAQAHAQVGKLPNISFEVMDITKPLDFPANSFDLVNARLIAFLSPEQWTGLLNDCMRILRPGGVIRLTENEVVTTNPATDKAFSQFYTAMARTRQGFSPSGRVLGITSRLNQLLKKSGFIDTHYRAHAVDFSAGTEIHDTFCQVAYAFIALMQPFLIGVGVTTPEDSERLMQQMQLEMYSDDFSALMFLLTAWGEKPQDA